MQYIDSVTGFRSGQGYGSESQRYIFERPSIDILAVLCINFLTGIVYLVSAHYKKVGRVK